jgi:hypothetical protein
MPLFTAIVKNYIVGSYDGGQRAMDAKRGVNKRGGEVKKQRVEKRLRRD